MRRQPPRQRQSHRKSHSAIQNIMGSSPTKSAKTPPKKVKTIAKKAVRKVAKTAVKKAAKKAVKTTAKKVARKVVKTTARAARTAVRTAAKTVAKTAVKKKPQKRAAYTPTTKEKYMSEKQTYYFQENLMQMLDDIGLTAHRTMNALRSSDSSTPDENDRASKESDFALELRERERESLLVSKIRHALQRLDSRQFGYCEECGDKIGLPRLLARSVATLCFECKNLQEYKEKIHS